MTTEHIDAMLEYAENNTLDVKFWRVNQKFIKHLHEIDNAHNLTRLRGVPVDEKALYKFSHHFFPIELHTSQGVVKIFRDTLEIRLM